MTKLDDLMPKGESCPICGQKEFAIEFVNGKVLYRCIWCNTRWYPEQLRVRPEGPTP